MYLMSPSLITKSALTPVSSRTSLSAVSSGFSPGSTRPLGRANTRFGVPVPALDRSALEPPAEARALSLAGSMAAIHQAPSRLRITTPPADISRTIVGKLAGLQELVILTRRRGNTRVTSNLGRP